ncbi:MAG: UPF0146 family protein [Halobacteriota archaeon]
MNHVGRDELADRLAVYDRLVEVGVGRRPDVAAALVEGGATVTATDIYDVSVPEGVDFVHDDIVARSESADPGDHYRVDAIYALNLPPELHEPTLRVAQRSDADFLFTTLGFDEPTVRVERETLDTETLYVVRRA